MERSHSPPVPGHEERPRRPVVGVGAVVFRGGDVLLIRRGKAPLRGQWSLPGGRQELGETVVDAVRREVREEAGIEIDVRDVVAVVDRIDRDQDGTVRFHYTLVDLLAEWRAGEPRAGDDAEAVTWAALEDLGRYALWEETERVIRLAAERRAAP
jgi:8-oxo-dGTP diphosphatase